MKRILFTIFFYLVLLPTFSQVRQKQSVNSGWQFVLNDKSSLNENVSMQWQNVNLPHTWNALDIVDDTLGYHQGIGWYQKEIFIPETYRDKHVELNFEGACNETTVFINGEKAGTHMGGFTGFRIDLDGKINYGKKNNVQVKVDNGKHLKDSVPPFSGDFSLMGGIYRDVWLVSTEQSRFQGMFGAGGVFFFTPSISHDKASFNIKTEFLKSSNMGGSVAYQLHYGGLLVESGSKKLKKYTGGSGVEMLEGNIERPVLWSPEVPALYQLTVQLKNDNGELLDEITQYVGFKWVGIGPNNEFLLNGKPYKLNGASRHQDYKNLGSALTNEMHVGDIELMKAMGCNFIRIAHYPQDPAIYEACDRLGLISWSEIPVVDRYVNNPTFSKNSMEIMAEMILQNYNHPSIAIWGYHNEVRNLEATTISNAKALDALAKNLDKYRLTAMAFESNIEAPYFTSNPLLKDVLNIADINGYNVYQGWYRGKHNDIGNFLDTLYAYNPAKPIMLSEYGAGSITNIHSYQPTLFDFSEEYQRDFHESYLKAGNTKPWMIGFAIWNFIDFQRDGREDVIPHINKKGMVTTDRQPKDVFYFYKSQWSKDPFVYLTGHHWQKRIAVTGGDKTISIPITAYSNKPTLQLLHNGKMLNTMSSPDGKFEWKVDVTEGSNQFLCKVPGGELADWLNVTYQFIDTTSFTKNTNWHQLNFNTGQSRSFFIDTKSLQQWMPDKKYSAGTWGYIDGEIWNTWPSAAWNSIREGIHKPIAFTENEPLFQTFVQGLTGWKAAVPAGKYRVSVLFCEPFTAQQRNKEERIFSIACNEQQWMQQINLEKDYGVQSAVIFDREIVVKGNEGINIMFKPVSGKAILNGISLQRL